MCLVIFISLVKCVQALVCWHKYNFRHLNFTEMKENKEPFRKVKRCTCEPEVKFALDVPRSTSDLRFAALIRLKNAEEFSV